MQFFDMGTFLNGKFIGQWQEYKSVNKGIETEKGYTLTNLIVRNFTLILLSKEDRTQIRMKSEFWIKGSVGVWGTNHVSKAC